MQSLRKSILGWFVLVPVLALAGCQKGGDSAQPTAAVTGPGGEKAESLAAAASDVPHVKSKTGICQAPPGLQFETGQGRFLVRLDAVKAPLTVENFHNYVARGHYDLTVFHQVLNKGSLQIVLGGGYTADLKEKATLTPIRNEAHNGLKNRRGTIAMARRPNDERRKRPVLHQYRRQRRAEFQIAHPGRLRLLRLRGSDRGDGCPRSDCHVASSRRSDKIYGSAGGAVVIKSVRQVK